MKKSFLIKEFELCNDFLLLLLYHRIESPTFKKMEACILLINLLFILFILAIIEL